MELESGHEMAHLQEQVAEVVEELKAVEELKQEIHQQQHQQSKDRQWINQVALSTGIFSALAAIAAMQGNFLANEGMVAQIRANDQWTLFQAKSTKEHIEQSSATILQALQKPVPAAVSAEITKLEQEKKEIQSSAQKQAAEARLNLEKHESFAYTVAALQVAISLGAVSALLGRRVIWYLGLGIAVVGIGFMAWGFFPHARESGESTATSVTY
jgi:hypothetical protein